MLILRGSRAPIAALFVSGVTSCAGGDAATYSGAVVDTLANGAVSVRNSAEGLWAATGATPWRLEEELRIGRTDGTGPDVFGSIRRILPNPDGSMWILDSTARELRLFDAQGRFVRKVGRPGEGPGEFALNTCAHAGLNDEIWVEDIRRRWQRFDRSGNLIGQIPVPSNLGCGVRERTTDGRYLAVHLGQSGASPMDRESFFIEYRFDASGELQPVDTFPSPVLPPPPQVTWAGQDGRPRMIQAVPLVHRPWWILGQSGEFLITPGGGPYVILRRALAGDTLLVTGRSYTPVVVPDSLRDASITEAQPEGMVAQGGFDADQVPAVYPPFEQFMEGPDRTLWVRRYVRPGELGLEVFSAEGIYLGAVEVPESFDRISIFEITSDHIYGVYRNELDVPHAVRLAILKPT